MSETAEEAIPSTDPVIEVQEGKPEEVEEENVKNEEETNADAPAEEEDPPAQEKTDADDSNANPTKDDSIEATGEETEEATDAEEAKESSEAPDVKDHDHDDDDAVKDEDKMDDAPEADADADAANEENSNDEPAPKVEGGDEDEVEVEAPKEQDVEMEEDAGEEIPADSEEKKKKKASTTPRKKRSAATVATPSSASSASKRQRKSTTSFSPMDFKEGKDSSRKVEIPAGRGVKLDTIEIIKTNVTKRKTTDPILAELHRFLLGGPGGCLGKGRTGKKLLKKHILEFSGYLPEVEEGDDEGEELERDAEERMQTKAENMSLPLLKTFCDILSVHRGPEEGTKGKKGKLATKSILVDRLLDFLSDPSVDGIDAAAAVATGKKRGPKSKKRQDEEESEAEDEEMEDAAEEEEAADSVPSQKALKAFVKAYLICFNSDKISEEHALQIATDKFGDDLGDGKDALAKLLKKALPKEA